MESVDLDMNDIFDNPGGADDSDDGFDVRALPDLQIDPGHDLADQPGHGAINDQEESNVEVLARIKNLAKGAAKKVVRRPQPKLDVTRLSGTRGFTMLPKIFADVKFRGNGHEIQDLDLMMRKYEHWAHRLFPKMMFDEVIDRVERLGAKREIQTMVKKLRMGIPLLMGENDDPQEGRDKPNNESGDDEESALDAIFRSERETVATVTPSQTETSVTPSTGISETQKERMERNRRIALERKMAKQGLSTPGPSPGPTPGSITGPVSMSQTLHQSPVRNKNHINSTNTTDVKTSTTDQSNTDKSVEIRSTQMTAMNSTSLDQSHPSDNGKTDQSQADKHGPDQDGPIETGDDLMNDDDWLMEIEGKSGNSGALGKDLKKDHEESEKIEDNVNFSDKENIDQQTDTIDNKLNDTLNNDKPIGSGQTLTEASPKEINIDSVLGEKKVDERKEVDDDLDEGELMEIMDCS